MKKTVLFIAVLLAAVTAKAQFNFDLTYGTLNTKRATFSYKMGNWAPYAALDAFTASLEFTNALDGPEELNTHSVSGSIIAPTLGVRYYFLNKQPKLKGFLNLSAQKGFVSGEFKEAFVDDPERDRDIKLSDMLSTKSLLQFQFGFGAEYFFNENLSLIGEYGLRLISVNIEGEPDEGGAYMKAKLSGVSITYARLGLGFYF